MVNVEDIAATAAKSLQSCPTLCDPIDGSPPGSPVPGILQARTLEWAAISFSSAWKWKGKVKSISHARLLATPWTAVYQASPSMEFSRQEYWSGSSLPSPVENINVKWNKLATKRHILYDSIFMKYLKLLNSGTFLVVQWLRFCATNAGRLGWIPAQRTWSHMPQLRGSLAATKDPVCHN